MGDGRVGETRERDDVACACFIETDALEPAKGEHLRHAALLNELAGMVEHLDRLVRCDRARSDAPGDDTAEIWIGFEDGAEKAERSLLDARRRNVAKHQLEQRLHGLVLGAFRAWPHPAFFRRAVENREVELLVRRFERGEQVEHLVHHLFGSRIGTIDLVNDDDRLQPHLERLGHDELGLRQRAFGRVDQDERAVHHAEDALDLAAEIGVAWRVDDVYARAIPQDRGRLGEDGDTALALEIVGIHRALGHPLILAERPGLLEEAVDEGGFPMVDVGNDGDISEVHRGLNMRARAKTARASYGRDI